MRKLVFEKAAIKQNLNILKEHAAGAVIYGAVSGNGGGAGITRLAQILRDEGISRFAVREVEEVEALRSAGFVQEEILVLRSPPSGRSWSAWWISMRFVPSPLWTPGWP